MPVSHKLHVSLVSAENSLGSELLQLGAALRVQPEAILQLVQQQAEVAAVANQLGSIVAHQIGM